MSCTSLRTLSCTIPNTNPYLVCIFCLHFLDLHPLASLALELQSIFLAPWIFCEPIKCLGMCHAPSILMTLMCNVPLSCNFVESDVTSLLDAVLCFVLHLCLATLNQIFSVFVLHFVGLLCVRVSRALSSYAIYGGSLVGKHSLCADHWGGRMPNQQSLCTTVVPTCLRYTQ